MRLVKVLLVVLCVFDALDGLAGTANFPELTDKIFVVNAPWAAVKGFNLVSPMLPPDTREKVQILGSGAFLPTLLEHCDISQLPSFLGGGGSELGGVDVRQGDIAMGVRPANRVPEGVGARLTELLSTTTRGSRAVQNTYF